MEMINERKVYTCEAFKETPSLLKNHNEGFWIITRVLYNT